jgi:uncharacterized protein (TIGR03437 family)
VTWAGILFDRSLQSEDMLVRYWALASLALTLSAQPTRTYHITTVAGTSAVTEGVPATDAVLDSPSTLAVGTDGVIYVGAAAGGIYKIRLDGVLAKIPGSGLASSIAVDAAGTLYYSFGGPEYYSLPVGAAASITSRPTDGVIMPERVTGVAVDSKRNVLLADQRVGRILRISPDGVVSVAAGIGSRVALSAAPMRLAVDSADRIYVTQADRRVIRISGETVELVAGNGQAGAPVMGGPATASPFVSLGSVAVSPRGEVFFLNYDSIFKVSTGGILESILPGQSASDIAFDNKGNLIYVNASAGKVWSAKDDGTRTLLAGTERYTDGVPATNALLKSPAAVAVDQLGALWIADTGNYRIRRVGQDGVIHTIGGNGVAGSAGDGGPATAAQLTVPNLLAIDQAGNVYVSTIGGQRVRRIKVDGAIETFAGTGEAGDSGDGGPANEAKFQSIGGLAVDGSGNVFVSDRAANRVRVIDRNGRIRTYAGTGEFRPGGEGTSASTSPLAEPSLLAADLEGNLVVYETYTGRLRRITRAGVITSWSGTSPLGTPGNQDAQSCNGISGLAFDLDGSLLVTGSRFVCRLMPDNTTWLVAGGSKFGFGGDGGPALSALLLGASGIATDQTGAILVADSGNHRVRKLERDNQGAAVALVPTVRAVSGAGGSDSAPQAISPGGLSSAFGTDFAPFSTAVAARRSDFVDGSLPTRLADTCVEIGGSRAFLTFVGSRQINFQAPDIPIDAMVTLQVIAGCGTSNEVRSSAWTLSTRRATPEFLYWVNDGRQSKPIVAVDSVTGEFIGAPGLIPGVSFVPAKSGELVTLYCISLGATLPPVPAGAAATAPAKLPVTPSIYIGFQSLPTENVLYAGLSPGTAGLYQINIRLPELADGDQQITMEPAPSDGFLTVRSR